MLCYYHVVSNIFTPEPCCAYTLQRASWLLPLGDQGLDNDEEVSVVYINIINMM